MNKKSGVTLMVMVITIVALLIIASAVIINMKENNIISNTKKVDVQSHMKIYLLELEDYIKAEMQKDPDYDKSVINAVGSEQITKYIPSYDKKYNEYIMISEGNLILKEDAPIDSDIRNWIIEVGLNNIVKPKVPDGFIKINSETNDEFTIRDKVTLNEFVWIPVPDITKFKRTLGKVEPENFPAGSIDKFKNEVQNTEENSEDFIEFKRSVIRNKGFYIGKYETTETDYGAFQVVRNPDFLERPLLPKTYNEPIDYNVIISKAKIMYSNNVDVKSNVISGTAFDYVMNFFVEKGILSKEKIYDNSTGCGFFSGSYDYLNQNYAYYGIYGLLGNANEMTLEKCENNYIARGGSIYREGNLRPAFTRYINAGSMFTPRVVLYFK